MHSPVKPEDRAWALAHTTPALADKMRLMYLDLQNGSRKLNASQRMALLQTAAERLDPETDWDEYFARR